MGRDVEDEIGQELWESRPTPTDEYIASIAGSVRGRRHMRDAGRRLAVAAVLSVIAVVALAATGGMTQASSAPQSVAKIVETAFKSKPAKAPKLNRVVNSAAHNQYHEKEKCNSGRGNGSEPPDDDSQLIDPHAGGTGPGTYPTVDCDPGNSGDQNRGGD